MNDEKYVYYAYRATALTDADLAWYFQNGIINQEGNNISQIMLPMDLKTITQEEYVKSLISGNYNAVVVAKFPKELFEPEIFYGQLKELPIPIWKEEVHSQGKTVSSLDSRYIYRIYYTNKTGELCYVNNESYSPINDPVGRQFDTKQLLYFDDIRAEKLFEYGVSRRKSSYEELCREDLANKTWDYTLSNLNYKYKVEDTHKLNKTI